MGKRRIIRLFIAVSALFVLLAAAPAYAAPAEVYRVSDSGLTASASLGGPSSCGYLALNIIATDGRIKADGRPEVSSALNGWYDDSNACTNMYRFGFFTIPLDDNAFQIDKKLNQATLHTTVEVCGWINWEPACFPMEIDLAWTGEGLTFRDKGRSKEATPHYKAMYSYDSTSRSSMISGSVVFPWESFTQGFYGNLSTTKNRQMQVYKL